MLPLEKTILRELFHRREFAELLVPYVKSEYFHSEAAGLLYKLYAAFFEKFKVVPQFTAIKIGLDSIPGLNEKEAQAAQMALKEVEAESPLASDQEPWLLENCEDWVKERAVHLGLLECIRVMDDPVVSKHVIPEIMKTALAVSFDKSVGHDFLNDADARYEFYHTEEARIPFDIETLNSMTKGGLPRKTLSVVMAGCVHPDTMVRIRFRKK